jgi:hypothetical protein
MKTTRNLLLLLGAILITGCGKTLSGEYKASPKNLPKGIPSQIQQLTQQTITFDGSKATIMTGSVGQTLSYKIDGSKIQFTHPSGQVLQMELNADGTISFMGQTFQKIK